MPNLDGVLETALYVEDVARSAAFYKSVLKLDELISDERLCALNVSNRQVLLLFKKGASAIPLVTPGGIISPHDGDGKLHMAFAISKESLGDWEKWLESKGVAVESRVRWERGGTSLYFRDPDEHLIELATPGIWEIY